MIELTDIFEQPDRFRCIVMVDHLEDPYNFGAIIRSCVGFGVSAVIYPKDRQVGITEGVIRASAHSVSKMPLIRVTNLAQTADMLEKSGYWLYGLDGHSDALLTSVTLNTPCVLIAGNEHKGISALLQKKCHALLKIPISSDLESLNVSVAMGIALYHFSRL